MLAWVVIDRRHFILSGMGEGHCQLARTAPHAHLFAFPPLISRLSVTLLESTLVEMPVTVDSKPLTCTVSPLDATLTKNPGEGAVIVNQESEKDSCPERAQRVEGSLITCGEACRSGAGANAAFGIPFPTPQRDRRMETNVLPGRPKRRAGVTLWLEASNKTCGAACAC